MRRPVLALMFLLGLAALPRAQVVMEEIGALQESFNAAQQAYQAVQFPKAVESLNSLIDTLTRWEQAGRLQPSDEALLERALELRGICAFNLGKTDLARQDWTRLIQLRPDYPFSMTKTPKIVRQFEEIRSSLTGVLNLSVQPADSQIYLDGRPLGTAVASIPVLKGMHVVKVSRPGYATQEREMTVDVGSLVAVDVSLIPNARTIYFFVQPEGTQLLVDGKPLGRAERPASSRDDWAKFVQESGSIPAQVYVIPALYLPPGDHRVTLVCPCFRQREFVLTVSLDKANNSAGFVKPIVLDRRTVNLEVISHPSGSEVTIDGQVAGTTPLRLSDFCIGPHQILVQKANVGLYRASINVNEVPLFKVDATLRPTLLWAGVTRDQDITAYQQQEADDAMAAAMPDMDHFNGTVADEKNPSLPDTFFTPGVGAQDQAATVRALCEKYRCQGLLAGKLTAESGTMTLALRLFVPELPGYDEVQGAINDPAEALKVLDLVDRPLTDNTLERVLPLADFPGVKGPVLMRGVSDPAGPSAGDILLAVGGVPVTTVASARAAFAASDTPALKFSHRGEEKVWYFKGAGTSELVPYGGERYGYRRQWLKARQDVLGSETAREQLVARLSLACANLNLGRPVDALAALEPLQPPATGPLNKNSVGYLRAVTLVQLGRPEEARSDLRAAAQDESASLDGLGAFLVAPLASDLLRQLPPPPPPVPGPGMPGGNSAPGH